MAIHAIIIRNICDIVVENNVIPCRILVIAEEKREGEKFSAIRAYDLAEKPVYEFVGFAEKSWDLHYQEHTALLEELKKAKSPVTWRVSEGARSVQEERDFAHEKHLDRYIRRLQERSI